MHQPSRHGRRAVGAAAAGAALALGLAQPAAADPGAAQAERPHFTLTVLHGQDAESHLLGAGDDPENFAGAARYTTLLRQLEEEARRPANAADGESRRRGVVTVNSGDTFLAGPEFSASTQEGAPFYDALALHYADYDAVTIGNHEFDFGPDLLAEYIESSPQDTPWLSSNLDVSGEPALAELAEEGRIAPSTVVRERGERIGIIGATTDELPSISNIGDVAVDPDYAATVQDEVDRLTADGVDIIVVSSHLQAIVNDKALARTLRGVDLFISGGGHETHARPDTPLVPGDEVATDPETGEPLEYPLWVNDAEGRDVPIFAAGAEYRYVGNVAANFDRDGELLSVSERSDAVRVSGVGEDAVAEHPGVRREITEPVQEHVDGLAQDVVAQSEVGLDGRRSAVRTGETNLGSLLADAQLAAARSFAASEGLAEPQVAIQNGGGIRNDSVIGPGEVTTADTFGVAPFANFVVLVPEVERQTLRELLERGVSGVPVAEGRFLQVAGMRVEYDASRQAQELDTDGAIAVPGERVRSVVLDDGTVVVDDGDVVGGDPIGLATIDFLAGGGDGLPWRDVAAQPIGATYQQALSDYLTEDLGGEVTAAEYPEGGEGRIVRLDG